MTRYQQYQETTRYNGAASRRTRGYANRGTNRGVGAAVNNRADALLAQYGNNPRNIARIRRAQANIMAKASVYK